MRPGPAQKQASLTLAPSPLPEPPTKDEQLHVLRLAVQALLMHGARADIVAQAEHALSISTPKNPPRKCGGIIKGSEDIPAFLRRQIGEHA